MFKFLSGVKSFLGRKKQVGQKKSFSPQPTRRKTFPSYSRPQSASSRELLRKKELKLIRILEETNRREKMLEEKRAALDEREAYLRKRERALDLQEKEVARKKEEAEKLRQERMKALEETAGLTREKAKEILVREEEKNLSAWMAKKIEEAKETIRANEEEIGREVLVEALRHGVTDYVAEYTVSVVPLPNEDIKGKIIGREGRNIRAFEKATGVELELDESNEIRLSSFDSVRREIAKIALQKLIRDGRIQPVRIEAVVRQTKNQMEKILLEEGKRICQEVGVYHLPLEIVKTIGRFKYRFSYGQNLAVHTIEETKIGVALAAELKADVKIVRLGCLLHDIGKVISDEEGSHVQIGVEFLRKFKFPPEVINCVAEHHEDKPFSSVESAIVWIADAASGSRPGARYQAHEEYLKRMSRIEEIIRSFKGIVDVAAYQAGREIRIIVKPEAVSDDQLTVLVQRIAEKLDEEAKWAGQIKITAIRETRAAATAPLRSN